MRAEDEPTAARAFDPEAENRATCDPVPAATADDRTGRAIRIPDHPQLEGLEESWAARWDAWGTYRFDDSSRAPTSTRSTRRHRRCRARCTSGTSSRSRRPISSQDSSACAARPSSTRSAGTTTVYRPSAGSRTTTGSAAIRPSPTTPGFPRRRNPRSTRCPSRGRTSSSCATSSRPRTSRPSRRCSAGSGSVVNWADQYTTIGRLAQRTSRRAFLRMVAAGHAYRQEAPTLWDVDFQTAVAQAELEDREIEANFFRVRFSSAETGTPVEIETTRPELIPACVALVANPDDTRYQALFGTTAVTPLFGVEIPIRPHPLADPEKGSGIAMVCTFGDLTDVTWWRDLGLATRTIVRRDGRLGRAPFGSPGWESRDAGHATAAYAELEGLTARQARTRIADTARGLGRSRRRATAHHALRQLLREGRTAPRDRLVPPVVRPDARAPAGADRRRARDRLAPRVHADPLRGLGRGTHRGLEHLAPALLRRALPGLVRRAGGRVDRRRPSDPRRGARAPPRPGDRRPGRLPGGPAGRAGGLRRRPRRDGHLGHVVAQPPHRRALGRPARPVRPDLPDGPASPGARDHPDMAVLVGGAQRARAPTACPGGTSRSPGGSSTRTTRRSRSRRATSSCRAIRSTPTGPTPSATGRRPPASASTPPSTTSRCASAGGSRSRSSTRRSSSCNAAPATLRSVEPTPPPRRAIPSTSRCSAASPPSSSRPPTPSRTTSTPGRSSGSNTSSGPSVTTTSSS